MTSTTAMKATGAWISIAPMGDSRQHRLAPACCCCFLWLRRLTFPSRDHWPNITLPVGGYFSFYYFYLERGRDDFSNLPAFQEMLGSGYPGCVRNVSVSYIQQPCVWLCAESQKRHWCRRSSWSCSWGLNNLTWVLVRVTMGKENILPALWFLWKPVEGGGTLRTWKWQ